MSQWVVPPYGKYFVGYVPRSVCDGGHKVHLLRRSYIKLLGPIIVLKLVDRASKRRTLFIEASPGRS